MSKPVCSCGSGLVPYWLYDGYRIPLTLVCNKCELLKLERYRPDILSRYEADEPIDSDE